MIKTSRQTFTVLKWIAGIVFVLFMTADAASWYLSSKRRPIVTKELKDLVLHATDSLYHVEFSTVNTNYLLGNASILDVRILPDTNIFNKLVRLKHAPNNIYEVRLKKLTIWNFHPLRLFKDKKLNVDQLLFEHPSVVMINKQFEFNENRPARPYKSPYTYISKFLKEVSVKSIDLKDVSFKYVNRNLPVAESDSLDNLNITFKDWLIDPHSATDPSRFYLLKDVLINLNDYEFATPDSLYHMRINALAFKASTGMLHINRFSLTPRYSEMDFGRVAGYAKDRFHIQMSDIRLNGIDLPLYVKKLQLSATDMTIDNGFVNVFNNNELPSKGTVRMGKFPHQLLQTVKGQLSVKKLSLNNVDFSYALFDRYTRQKGKITFENTSGSISNVTNEIKVKEKNPFMLASLDSYMMGQGKLHVNFKFDLNAKNGAFSYSGQLTNMKGSVLNKITKPLGLVQVKSGEVQKLNFNVVADETQAKGNLAFAYDGLSIGLLKKVQGKNRLVKQGLISMLANALVINPANPNKAGEFITAPINFQRDPTNSFFSFIWQSLFQGIKYTVGLTPKKEAEIAAKVAQFEKMKADRAERRENRQKRHDSRTKR
ncbi:hypothetical protein SAMN06265348_10885 [Pedobacter westerhofensis]|uniref:AsmA-like C-terminal region n=1 Tax=Pedobacter westerhofensis TaxID=425512 RepID=A0A521EH16_9SPHI|nr:hypothetical protein [Pedobacter westerhofensis]SMO83152.1 hypothetical protein SAMN06265348_10885 [Pedobacter westerhofensis]